MRTWAERVASGGSERRRHLERPRCPRVRALRGVGSGGASLAFKRSKRGKMVFSVKPGLGPIRFGEPC